MVNPVQFTPLRAPRIFGDRDLTQYMLDIIEVNSNGALNDRAPHAPTVVITDAVEFCRLELEYSMDKIAEKAAILHLQTCGIQRRLGRKATVTLTFTLSANLAQFVLSAGYMVQAESGLEFYTDVDVVATNTSSFTVTATAKEVGTKYNVAAFRINSLSQTRAFLASVTNTEPAAGGLDAESEEEAKARGYQTIRRKKGVLISRDDFEQYAMEVLGVGSVARVVPLLAPDKQTKKAGYVHVFCLNIDGTQLNDAQRQALQNELNLQFPVFLQDVEGQKVKTIASGVTVSSIELYPLEINVVANLIPGDNPETRALAINKALVDFLTPGRLPLGETVVLYSLVTAVQNTGVRDVQSVSAVHSTFDPNTNEVTTQPFYSNIPLPNEWTAAYCLNVAIALVDTETNTSLEFVYGEGGDLD